MHASLRLLLVFALLITSVAAGAPKIGCAAEVGAPAGTSRNWVLVMLKFIDEAKPHRAYRVYWKAGNATAPNPYVLLSTLRPTVSPVSLAQLLDRAGQAGVDLAAFETKLDGILNGHGSFPTLAEKLSFLLQAQSENGLLEFQMEVLANSHPVVAAARGRAYFAAVPSNGASTFEVRAYDPATQSESVVVGRPTVQTLPEWLPAPDCLSEKSVETPRGHLRIQLRWCYPLALRHKFLHFGGTRVIRASNPDWQAAFGVAPPLNLTRAELLQAIADNHAVVVNGLPLFPEERPADQLDPAYDLPLFTDDNDSALGSALTTGAPFIAGEEFTYWVWEEDLFGRPGHPSPGTSVTACDRIAPDPPQGLTATNVRIFEAGSPRDVLRLEWPTASPVEVRRWYLYCSVEFNGLLENYDPADPEVAAHFVALIDNDGSHETLDGERIRFDHDATAPLPLPAPGHTVYYRLRAEDDTPCKDREDRGNISGPSGPVPASIHEHSGANPTGAWLEVPCCNIAVSYQSVPGDRNNRPYTANLRALRPSDGFQWVEFRDQIGFIGRYEFDPEQTQLQIDFQPGNSVQRTYGARFGHRGGLVSPWRDASSPDAHPYDLHIFEPRWACIPIPPLPTSPRPNPPQRCPGYHLPHDPETGEPNDVCVRFANLGGNLKSWVVYKQFGIDGPKTKLASGNVGPGDPPILEVCDHDFPPGGGEICYYVQGFGPGGNPGPMELAGCVKVAPVDGLPRPTITHTQPSIEVVPTASIHDHNIGWYSPIGAERFEIALWPVPASATATTFINARKFGIIETPRLATGWGQTDFDFLRRLPLVHGVNYRCRVRAVVGHGDERDHGPWSDPETLHWLNQPSDAPEVPWPMRDAPGITGPAVLEWDSEDCILRVAIGELPIDSLSIPLPADTMAPYLYHDLPMVAYLRDTTAGASGKMLQVSRRLDEILTTSPSPGTGPITIVDEAVKVSIGDGTPLGHLWLRIEQGVLSGHTYEVFLVLHNPVGEIREVLRTNEVLIVP